MNKSFLAKQASIVALSLLTGAALAQTAGNTGSTGRGDTGPDADGTAQVKPKSDPTVQGSGTATNPSVTEGVDDTRSKNKAAKDNKRKGTRGNAASRESTDGAPQGTMPTNENNTTGTTR